MDSGLSEPATEGQVVHVEAEPAPQDAKSKAQEYLTLIRKAIITQGAVFLHIGFLLKTIKEEKLYAHMGTGGYDSFHQFLGGPELSISQTTAYALIAIYNRYIERFKYMERDLQDIPWYKLQLLGSIEPADKADADEWIEKARTLGPSDFRIEVAEFKGNKGHTHPIPYPHVYRCKDCKLWRIEIDPKYECYCVQPA